MAGKDIIVMSSSELKRLKFIQLTIDKEITEQTVSTMTGVSERQIRRLVKAVWESGNRGIIHRLRGLPSNRRICDETKEKVLALYRKQYFDFGPTLATEKLLELDGIRLSGETMRKWLIEAGLWQKKRKRPVHRQ